MDLVIRRARPSDKREVIAAVRTLWGGNDRVPGLFDSWVTHRTGPFFVALSSDRVVGMGKITIASPTEGWLEGGRVAPRWRRKGIATALIAHRIAYAHERGLRVVRFSTGSDNLPMRRAARTFGFALVGSLAWYRAPALDGPALPPAARSLERAVLRRLGRYVQRGHGWEWRALTVHDVRVAMARGRTFVSDDHVGAAALIGDRDDDTLSVAAIGGNARALRDLMIGLRAVAFRRGLDAASFYAASAAERRAARAAGYRRPWSEDACLFEKKLR